MAKDSVLRFNIVHFLKPAVAPYKTQAAFQALYLETHLSVFRYIYGLNGGSIPDAEDVTADTFTRAWKSRARFAGDADAALGWLLKIARNRVIDMHRQYHRRKTDTGIEQMELVAPDAGPEEQVILDEQSQILQGLLRELPDDKREMLVLRYMLGWPVQRIAQHFDLRENTVSATIRRSLQQLRANWPQDLERETHE